MAADQIVSGLPVGTVTLLLTDIEGSSVDEHDQLVASAVGAHHGVWLDGHGRNRGAMAVFAFATDAAASALQMQQALGPEPSSRLRIGLHTGETHLQDRDGYADLAVHRGECLRDVAHGGQTLLSSVTAALVADALPPGAWIRDLGLQRLRDLSPAERVFELCHADLADDFPPLRSLDVLANNLPAQLTSFVGRGDELAAVEQLLGDHRLVTLTGSGGCGKTRLAVHAAARVAERWPDGVWWLDLGPVTDPARVAELAAATMKVMVEPVGGPLRALSLYLRDRRLLVCLDNCEHLLEASAELADALLRACSQVSVLVTSREPLGVAGEIVWRVPSLVENEAVSLFAERAAQVRPGFAIDDRTEAAVRMVCRRLDGIPLAVELAAAWLRVLTPAQVGAALDDRFRLLTGGAHGVVARQQTLAASVEWSHDLLDGPERMVFRQLAVFSGGFTVDAARVVCTGPGGEDDVLLTLGRLVDKSLVLVEQTDHQARYRLLETIRHYAQDRLRDAGEGAAARDRHLDYFLALAETAETELEHADQDAWLARLESENDNLRSALEWGLSAADGERGRRLAAALPRMWLLQGRSREGIEYLERAIELAPDERSTLQARLLAGAGQLGAIGGRFDLTVGCAQRGLEIAAANDDHHNQGRCLDLLAYTYVYFDFATTRDLCAEARCHTEAAGDAFGTDLSLVLEGLALTNGDRHGEARPILEAALQRSRRRGDRNLAAFALMGQMYGALFTGDVRRADALGTQAVRLAEPQGNYYTAGFTTSNLAWVKGMAGDIDGAMQLLEKVVRSVEGADSSVDVPTLAISLGQLHLWRGDLDGARGWFERAARFGGLLVDNMIVARAFLGLATAHRRSGDLSIAQEHLSQSIALGRKLDLPRILADALDESAALLTPDDADRAERLHHEALALRVGHGLRTCYVDSLDVLARQAVRAERDAEAARIYAASDAARELMGYPRPPVERAEHDAAVAALRDSLDGDSMETAWSEGAALSLDDAVAYVSRSRGSRGRPRSGWASLTPTELKVVGLAVEGLTNPEIANRLFMGRETVKTHLSHVYAKLDVTNRVELAALATHRERHPPG